MLLNHIEPASAMQHSHLATKLASQPLSRVHGLVQTTYATTAPLPFYFPSALDMQAPVAWPKRTVLILQRMGWPCDAISGPGGRPAWYSSGEELVRVCTGLRNPATFCQPTHRGVAFAGQRLVTALPLCSWVNLACNCRRERPAIYASWPAANDVPNLGTTG